MQNAVIGIVCLPMFRYLLAHAFGALNMTLLLLEILMNLYENRQAANFERLPGYLYIHFATRTNYSAWFRYRSELGWVLYDSYASFR